MFTKWDFFLWWFVAFLMGGLFIEMVLCQVTVFSEGIQILLRSGGILVLLE